MKNLESIGIYFGLVISITGINRKDITPRISVISPNSKECITADENLLNLLHD